VLVLCVLLFVVVLEIVCVGICSWSVPLLMVFLMIRLRMFMARSILLEVLGYLRLWARL